MITILNKETHVFLKDADSFTTVAKKPDVKGRYQVFTTKKLYTPYADDIERLYKEITVQRIDIERGFILIKLQKGYNYNSIVSAVKTVLYE